MASAVRQTARFYEGGGMMRVNLNLSDELARLVVEQSRLKGIPQSTFLRRSLAQFFQIDDVEKDVCPPFSKGALDAIPTGVVAG